MDAPPPHEPYQAYAALREGAGVLDLSSRGRLCLLGADRQRFLNGQVTNNVKDLQIGHGCYAALVSAKGKLQSDLNIYCLENELLLDFESGYVATVTQRLEKYVIAEDVQIIDASQHYGLISVQGPKAASLLEKYPAKPMEILKVEDASLGEIYVANRPRLLATGFDLFIPVAAMQKAVEQLLKRGGQLCGSEAFETARIEDGIPRFGVDMDESNLAPEALDERAISYSKGCYIGQEVIARVRTYGQVSKSLRRLKMEKLPAKGAKLYYGDKEAGYVTSAVQSPATGEILALGYIRRGISELTDGTKFR
jgi:aminomethyltransferase